MRKPKIQPSENLIPDQPPHREGEIRQERSYRLITPLFGGGVEPGVADPVTVIRGTAIRGHLRFWWRACRGGQFGSDPTKMKAVEGLIWGAASERNSGGVSKVQIAITTSERGSHFIATDRNDNIVDVGKASSRYSYVAFPLQQSLGKVQQNVTFTLSITFPTEWTQQDKLFLKKHGIVLESPQAEIIAALWAWETFGGIGARTRRGFGALERTKIEHTYQTDNAEAWIRRKLKEYVCGDSWPDNVPHLSADILLHITKKRAERDSAQEVEVWQYLFDALRDFRQARTRRYGRSNWPEAESIRLRTGRRSPQHGPMPTSGKFPRAAFGLPIILQFKREDQAVGDPPGNNTLVGAAVNGTTYERLASPLILRPFVFGQHTYGLAAVLQGVNLPERVILKFGQPSLVSGRSEEDVETNLDRTEAAVIMSQDKKFKLLGTETDIIRAFLTFLQRRPV